MNEHRVIDVVVGYMLKVLKSGADTSKFNAEFSAIRHGNYYIFISLIGKDIPEIYSLRKGKVKLNDEELPDFARLLMSAPSLIEFYKNIYDEYGEIKDDDITNEIYEKVVYFELALRMRANNLNLIKKEETLNNVINKLINNGISDNDANKLHNGRKFLNMIKHPNKQFNTWREGIDVFKIAYNLLVERQFVNY